MRFKYLNNISKAILFAPLLIYVGQRSYIAYDEGFYTLQAEVYRRNDEIIDIESIRKNVQKNIEIYFKIENKDFYFCSHKYIEYAYPINLFNQKPRIKKFINWLNVNDIYQIGNFGIWEFMWSDQSYNSGKILSKKM